MKPEWKGDMRQSQGNTSLGDGFSSRDSSRELGHTSSCGWCGGVASYATPAPVLCDLGRHIKNNNTYRPKAVIRRPPPSFYHTTKG
jgi:hypothetical protein